MRLMATTFNIEEAKQISNKLELEGYITKLVQNRQGSLSFYEVWADKKEGAREIKNI